MSTILPQLSPNALIGNPANLNPLAHAAYNVSAVAAGTAAQQKIARDKSDSVTISRQGTRKGVRDRRAQCRRKRDRDKKGTGQVKTLALSPPPSYFKRISR